jgi:KaiC/GvpD/RAD55 family RecA-like ATPase
MSEKHDVEVLIIDSLNTVIPYAERSNIFATFNRWASSGSRILLMILDSSPTNGSTDVWEFASDIVIRLNRKYDVSGYTGYMVRSIEIEKARYQKHVWGRHQLKIHEGSNFVEHCAEGDVDEQVASDRMRAHPYRRQGGIFIFPSIHYVLSLYKRKAPTTSKRWIPSCVPNLSQLLGEGYPSGRCTALIGLRGGHKSHLGYTEILSRILPEKDGRRVADPDQRALVVSLRDDEGFTKGTMVKILKRSGVGDAERILDDLQKQGLLEITYYPPGYITPEEFFHRLLVSIKRLKTPEGSKTKAEPHVSLLFNSLEQLSSRFPLCAKEPIFVPGIIHMLSAEDVSSFFVTAVEGQAKETYGLETMAELILEFDRRTCSADEFMEHVKQAYPGLPDKLKSVRKSLHSDRQVIVLKVGRYAGGQAAGAEGILELVGKGHPLEKLDEKRDLIFMPSGEVRRKASGIPEILETLLHHKK